MRYRERVRIEVATREQGPTGELLDAAWTALPGLESVPAMILVGTRAPQVLERLGAQMTVVDDSREVVIEGRHPEITPEMRIVDRSGTPFRIADASVSRIRAKTILWAHRFTPGIDPPAVGS